MLGSTGSINLPYGSWMVNFGQLLMMPAWASHAVALLPGVAILVMGIRNRRQRQAANLSVGSVGGLVFKALFTTIAFEAAVFYLNLGRGVPWMFGLFALLVVVMNYVFTRTQVGTVREGSRRQRGGCAQSRHQCHLHLPHVLCTVLAAGGPRRCSVFRTARLRQSAGGHR